LQSITGGGLQTASTCVAEFDSFDHFQSWVSVINVVLTGQMKDIMDYRIGNAHISPEKVIETLLPSREAFEKAVTDFGVNDDDPIIEKIRALYPDSE